MSDSLENKPLFRVYRKDECLTEIVLDGNFTNKGSFTTLSESERVTFEVEPKETGVEYRIQIGDIVPENALGKGFRRHVEWPSEMWFESARGLVDIRLFSRKEDADQSTWQLRATLFVGVASSKFTELIFESMVKDLAALSSGLLFDLMSKSFAGISRKHSEAQVRISPRSAQLELRFLESLVKDVSSALLEISQQPQTTLRSERVIATWTGCERLSNDGISWFLARGLDPRKRQSVAQLSGPCLNVMSNSSCTEHGVIRWFLELILERTAECARRAMDEQACLESDKPYRNCCFRNEPSLYDLFDIPKILRLREAVSRARKVDQSIRGMLALPFLRNERPRATFEPTPVFRHVLSYHRFWNAMQEYLRRSTVLLEYSLDERNKPTWRMYEQWVFLQIAAACEEIGLIPSSHESLFRRLGAHMFTVDLRRGTRLGFTSIDGRTLLMRYEPWIFSKDIARRNADSVFQGREGEVPWSPDILIEIFEPQRSGRTAQLVLALVVDAKYTRRIEEHHWDDTGKYQMIRSTNSGNQVVRQVWIASPVVSTDGTAVIFRDPSVTWLNSGPDSQLGDLEFLQGAVSLIPDPSAKRGHVCPSAREFLLGLLNWLRFPEAKDQHEASYQ